MNLPILAVTAPRRSCFGFMNRALSKCELVCGFFVSFLRFVFFWHFYGSWPKKLPAFERKNHVGSSDHIVCAVAQHGPRFAPKFKLKDLIERVLARKRRNPLPSDSSENKLSVLLPTDAGVSCQVCGLATSWSSCFPIMLYTVDVWQKRVLKSPTKKIALLTEHPKERFLHSIKNSTKKTFLVRCTLQVQPNSFQGNQNADIFVSGLSRDLRYQNTVALRKHTIPLSMTPLQLLCRKRARIIGRLNPSFPLSVIGERSRSI